MIVQNNSTLKINGVVKEFPQALPATLAELIQQLNVESATVVAELDGRIIEREKFASTTLKPGQNIELVRFVPGG
jgi:thiamine biosynthesis protein ThiS